MGMDQAELLLHIFLMTSSAGPLAQRLNAVVPVPFNSGALPTSLWPLPNLFYWWSLPGLNLGLPGRPDNLILFEQFLVAKEL